LLTVSLGLEFVRALPLLVLPLVMPVNIDLLFFTFALFFYGYGVVLHCAHEAEWPDAHHPIINTSFQHFAHHARSVKNKPYHTGFFFKVWDQLAGSVYDQPCFCSKCARARGEREYAAWLKIVKPDYSPLLRPSFWLTSNTAKAQ